MTAPQPADERQIVMRLDPLGGRLHVERAREPDDRRDYRGVHAVLVGGPKNEALVDLDLVERRLLQIAERRIAGAEIVEDRQSVVEGKSVYVRVTIGGSSKLKK